MNPSDRFTLRTGEPEKTSCNWWFGQDKSVLTRTSFPNERLT